MSDAATKPADSTADKEAKKKPALEIRAAMHRRRAGFAFGPEPVAVPLAALDKKELAAIEADPLLTIKRVEIRE